VTSDQL